MNTQSPLHQALLRTSTAQERLLHQNSGRHDVVQISRLLHAEFIEFGRSGRTYTKAATVTSLAEESSSRFGRKILG